MKIEDFSNLDHQVFIIEVLKKLKSVKGERNVHDLLSNIYKIIRKDTSEGNKTDNTHHVIKLIEQSFETRNIRTFEIKLKDFIKDL